MTDPNSYGLFDDGFEYDAPNLEFEGGFLDESRDRYHNPKPYKSFKERHVLYSHAIRAANYIELQPGSRSHMVTAGSFEFGDFIEALLKERQIQVKRMTVSTLSLSRNNVDSLGNLLHDGWVDRLDLIVSDYFFAHERKNLIPYMLHELDLDNRFQLAVAGSHTKIATFETYGGHHVVMHGSANLRSSACLEQTTIEENRELHDFYVEFHDSILREYSVINKPIRHKKLWRAVQSNFRRTTPAGDPGERPEAEDEDKNPEEGTNPTTTDPSK